MNQLCRHQTPGKDIAAAHLNISTSQCVTALHIKTGKFAAACHVTFILHVYLELWEGNCEAQQATAHCQ